MVGFCGELSHRFLILLIDLFRLCATARCSSPRFSYSTQHHWTRWNRLQRPADPARRSFRVLDSRIRRDQAHV
ncbi:hypothetical protein EDD16DRAFT_1644015 [Pisolithus croceorrhizus]|nr:hypothetical protein EDD16DRAFT_1644015 [Pisolithus croceorrhizus]